MRVPGVLLAVVLLSACGCASKKGDGPIGNGNGNGNGHGPQIDAGPPPAAAECDGLREAVDRMYAQAYPAPADETPEAGQLREQERRDNVDMVLADCRRDPGRVIPCARTAIDVNQLERACLIPLDDQGNAEQKQFGK